MGSVQRVWKGSVVMKKLAVKSSSSEKTRCYGKLGLSKK